MREITPGLTFIRTLLNNPPDATAWVTGNRNYPGLSGLVHIHEFGDCTPPFDKTGGHYNREDRVPNLHPEHSGDLIPLFGNQGYAWTAFYDKRIVVPEITGKSVVVHRMRDDFTSQPAGDSGEKIACGVIRIV